MPYPLELITKNNPQKENKVLPLNQSFIQAFGLPKIIDDLMININKKI